MVAVTYWVLDLYGSNLIFANGVLHLHYLVRIYYGRLSS